MAGSEDNGRDELKDLLHQMETAASRETVAASPRFLPPAGRVPLGNRGAIQHWPRPQQGGSHWNNVTVSAVFAVAGTLFGSALALILLATDLRMADLGLSVSAPAPKSVTGVTERRMEQPGSVVSASTSATTAVQTVVAVSPPAPLPAAAPSTPRSRGDDLARSSAAVVDTSSVGASETPSRGPPIAPSVAKIPAPAPTPAPAKSVAADPTFAIEPAATPEVKEKAQPHVFVGRTVAQPPAVLTAVAAPRVVGPAEWSAPAGRRTRLPITVEPPSEAHRHHVLVSGLEPTAFVVKGVELFTGTWMLKAGDLAQAMVERGPNAPSRANLAIELREDGGTVVSRLEVALLGPPDAAEPKEPVLHALVSPPTLKEADHLLQQARQLLGRGDIVNARVLLEHATTLGNAEAALELGATYGNEPSRPGAGEGAGNREKARVWYERAAALGSEEARRRIAAMLPE